MDNQTLLYPKKAKSRSAPIPCSPYPFFGKKHPHFGYFISLLS